MTCIFSVLCLGLSLSSPMPQEDHPLAAGVRPQLKDVNKPFTLLVKVKTKEGNAAKLMEMMKPVIQTTRKEKGCIMYVLHQHATRQNEFMLVEKWGSLKELNDHLHADHTTKLLAGIHEILEEAPDLQVMLTVAE